MKRSIHRAGMAFFLLTIALACSMAQKAQPRTNLDFNDSPEKLQFAIISDLWGGNRPGIFEDAVEKLELLQPQFVMSVGDLIDGKVYDSIVLDTQWKEFNRALSPLSMPFFYLPGNHDISNPWMEKEWKRRYSETYYSFTHNNVLFLCVDTEDGGASTKLSPEQISYFKKVIRENKDVRWTFVFMHRPVWQYEDGKEDGFENIEAFLKGRNYTVFSGHHHTYGKAVKSGHNYYALGTTGGGSDLRGVEYGEFDHITMVTLTGDGPPQIINLKLDGMLKDDVVPAP